MRRMQAEMETDQDVSQRKRIKGSIGSASAQSN